jgi:CheY-specific phosphatase CheX
MLEQNVEPLLTNAVNAVLETMFFTVPLGPATADTSGAVLEARVEFDGITSGVFGVRTSEAAARTLASGFLGEEEQMLTASQIGQVVCELTNMVCGYFASKLKEDGRIHLAPPVLLARESDGQSGIPISQQSFAIENGALTVSLYLDGPG